MSNILFHFLNEIELVFESSCEIFAKFSVLHSGAFVDLYKPNFNYVLYPTLGS